MTTKHLHRPESEVRGFFDTLISNEMPEAWVVIYVLALGSVAIFLLTG